MRCGHRVGVAITIGLAAASAARADLFSDTGWDALVERIGIDQVPTGDDVIAAQVEAPTAEGR